VAHSNIRLICAKAACALAIVALASLPLLPASAHGQLDQRLGNDLVTCDPFAYPASVTAAGGQAQEFVPSQPGLAAVELCVRAESGPTNVTVRVRSGTAGAPGAVIGGTTIVVDLQKWEHADFAAPIVVTPGDTYIIELATDAGLEVTWFGNPYDADFYADGESNAPGVVRDFAFRTYASSAADTPTPSVTRTATPTKTRTPSPTRTPQTPTPAPTGTSTPVPSSATPPPSEPSAIAAAATPPPRDPPSTTPTRTSAVLGGARRTGAIRLPDVGDGDARSDPGAGHARSDPRAGIALAIALLGTATIALAISRPRRSS
jgi:hypothetical protein